MHIIADMSHLAKRNYEVSVCSLGIMGTKFEREVAPVESIEVMHKSSGSITVEKVRSIYDIGD